MADLLLAAPPVGGACQEEDGSGRAPLTGLQGPALDAVEAADRAQDVRHHEGLAVLVVLPEEDERPPDRARRAVERVDELRCRTPFTRVSSRRAEYSR